MKFETIRSEYVEYGNKFIEISRKRVEGGDAENEGEEFLNISKGYYTPTGEKRYKGGLGFPVDSELVGQISDKLKAMVSESEE
ncbi:MAG: hypothetical protein A7315_04235 [Candidatus Altiarchaeales archaeon WOR_SM1_79]|nr:MAG: hypothetical protein A7315_04235 [Candidatus Altiarchaeales archaeon WOR_SM1_79]